LNRPCRDRIIKVRMTGMVLFSFSHTLLHCCSWNRWRIGFIQDSHLTKQMMRW
jgi:hypothetical protein